MPSLFARIRELVTAQTQHGFDEIGNPKPIAPRVLRDLADTQHALVTALEAEKQLVRQRERLLDEAFEWEQRAERMLSHGSEDFARRALEQAVSLRGRAAELDRPIAGAQAGVNRIRDRVTRLKADWESACG